MNANFFRTILAIVTVGIGALSAIGQCVTDAITGVVTCSASWLTPQLMGIFVMVLGAAHVVLKLLNGWSGLTATTVPVSPSGAPGTVTQTQVDSGPRK